MKKTKIKKTKVIIMLGYGLRKLGFIDNHFVNVLNKYVFRVGLPVLLFFNVYNIGSIADVKFGVIGYASKSIRQTIVLGAEL